MGETFTLTGLQNQTEVKNSDVKENLEGDDLIFYHSLRAELDLLKKNPKLQTIHYILDHSKSLR
ncbi:MAG: hypothetical protein ACXVAY_06840 [Mucilaginibacter sp.]